MSFALERMVELPHVYQISKKMLGASSPTLRMQREGKVIVEQGCDKEASTGA